MKALILAAAFMLQAPDLAPEDEARAQDVMREVRCMVCAGESILDSNATMAADMRRFVRERVAAGMSEAQVRQALVERFGEEVLMRPPVNARTAPLWLAPVIILALGGVLLIAAMRKRT